MQADVFKSDLASTGCSEDAGVVTCDIGDLANGTSITLEIVVTAPAEAGTLSNEVVVMGNELHPIPANTRLFLGDLNDGARYNPTTDSWTPITLVGAPTPREVAQGVWTGSELLLWGGANDSSGGRYDPLTDSWRPTTLVDAPHVRVGGRWSTVWTGSEMIIWGGIIETQQGSRYCAAPGNGIFSDGFESGDASAWSQLVP